MPEPPYIGTFRSSPWQTIYSPRADDRAAVVLERLGSNRQTRDGL